MRLFIGLVSAILLLSGDLQTEQTVVVRPVVKGYVNSQQMWDQMQAPAGTQQQPIQIQQVPYQPMQYPYQYPQQPAATPQYPPPMPPPAPAAIPQPPYQPPPPPPPPPASYPQPHAALPSQPQATAPQAINFHTPKKNRGDSLMVKPAGEHDHSEPHTGGHSHFGYSAGIHGPDKWYLDFPQCAGTQQSPIDINQQSVQMVSMAPMRYINYWASPSRMVLQNNEHTLEISGLWPEGLTPSVTGGPLLDIYQFQQMHIHWGLDDASGSEHTVNGRRFPMELHVVHYNTKYGSLDNALNYKDGLTVLGFFFEIADEPNPMIGKFIKYMKDVTGNQARSVEIEPVPINVLDLDFDDDYVTYQGSLTTPPCAEVVTWLVSVHALTISKDQMQVLRSVVKESNNHDIHNFRPIQPLNNRPVYMVI